MAFRSAKETLAAEIAHLVKRIGRVTDERERLRGLNELSEMRDEVFTNHIATLQRERDDKQREMDERGDQLSALPPPFPSGSRNWVKADLPSKAVRARRGQRKPKNESRR